MLEAGIDFVYILSDLMLEKMLKRIKDFTEEKKRIICLKFFP